MRKKLFPLAAFALMMASCANEELINSTEELTDPVTFSGGYQTTTRSIIGDKNTDGTYPVLWSVGDALGVVSTSTGTIAANAKATLTEASTDFKTGTFSSLNVKMAATGNTFNIYYPYTATSAADGNTPGTVSYKTDLANPYIQGTLSSTQTQLKADDCTHFSKYGYAVAQSAAVSKGTTVGFAMKHVLSYLELNLKASGDLTNYAVQEVYVVAPSATKLTGPFNGFFDGTYAAVAGLETAYSNTLSLNIAETSEKLTATPQKFLMTLLPVDLSDKDLQIVVQVATGADNALQTRFYTIVLEGRKFESGTLSVVNGSLDAWERIYPMKAAVIWYEGTDEVITDVALTSSTAGDLSAGGTQLANSYMVTGAGTYSFPAKLPNGEPCLGIDGAENYISFTIPPMTAPFNASIGLYFENSDDATHDSNRILWSWHIWHTSAAISTTVVNGVTFMDRDLGATNTIGIESMGYYFQWGRKDPFPRVKMLSATNENPTVPGEVFSNNTLACTMNTTTFGDNLKWEVERTSNYSGYAGGYQDLAKYPTKFVDGVSIGTNGALMLTDGHKQMPSYGQDVWENTAKTNNPCPYGYHVPTQAEMELVKATAGRTRVTTGSGVGFNIPGIPSPLFLASAGYRNNEYGQIQSFQNQTLFWTSTIRPNMAYKYAQSLQGTSTGGFDFYQGRISSGRSVRCAQD